MADAAKILPKKAHVSLFSLLLHHSEWYIHQCACLCQRTVLFFGLKNKVSPTRLWNSIAIGKFLVSFPGSVRVSSYGVPCAYCDVQT